MNKLEDIVEALELKVSKTLDLINHLKATNEQLSKQLDIANKEIRRYEQSEIAWNEKYDALKTANALLGSDENKKETKFKINALIREIDHCIAQLAE